MEILNDFAPEISKVGSPTIVMLPAMWNIIDDAMQNYESCARTFH